MNINFYMKMMFLDKLKPLAFPRGLTDSTIYSRHVLLSLQIQLNLYTVKW